MAMAMAMAIAANRVGLALVDERNGDVLLTMTQPGRNGWKAAAGTV
jgi:hypothetical protein